MKCILVFVHYRSHAQDVCVLLSVGTGMGEVDSALAARAEVVDVLGTD